MQQNLRFACVEGGQLQEKKAEPGEAEAGLY